jgi:integrase/recombinase XerD
MPEYPSNDMTQNAKPKSSKAQLVARIARVVKKAGLDYAGWRYVSKRVRRLCDMRPEKKGRRLPVSLPLTSFAGSILWWIEPRMCSTP